MQLGLENKVAFVSGSTRGIGAAIAEKFAEESARVVITGRSKASLQAAEQRLAEKFPGTETLFLQGDMTDPEAIGRALEQTVSRFGQIDVLIANVGGGPSPNGLAISDSDWTEGFRQDLFGSADLAIAAVPHLTETQGAIVFISSITGIECIDAPIPYSAAKAAIHSLAKGMARQLGPRGVRVNTVAPGNVIFPGGNWDTKMKGERREFFTQYIDSAVPMKRFGQPEEIADVVLFLASERASFVTGACLVADGGQTRTHP